jgi:ubiquinone/menaquinone biosynthesis C-methylase UbiE
VSVFNAVPRASALDIGCGTGAWLGKMADMRLHVSGVDISREAVHLCRSSGLGSVVVGNANALPFAAERFGVVTCIDVFECEAAAPIQLAGECVRVLHKGGVGVVVMAAHQWLLSEHDRAVHSVRRYSRGQLVGLLRRFPVTLLYTGYLFSFLFPFMALWKMVNSPRRNIPREEAVSDVRIPHPVVNGLLDRIGRVESRLVPGISLPAGTSVCAVFRKNV